MIENLWLAQLILSVLMMGVIWIIQIVHYPGFRYVDIGKAEEFHRFHTARIAPLVAPVMIGELFFGLWLLYVQADNFAWIVSITNLMLWLSTFLVQVPLHNKLSNEWNLDVINRLVQTNWIRTVLWSAKALLVGYYVAIIL